MLGLLTSYLLLCLTAVPVSRASIDIEDKKQLDLMIHPYAAYPTDSNSPSLKVADMRESVTASTFEERTLKGLAYIPLGEQELHSDYWKEGFPRLDSLIDAPVLLNGLRAYSAIPRVEDADGLSIYVSLTKQQALSDPKWKDLGSYCKPVIPSKTSSCISSSFFYYVCTLRVRDKGKKFPTTTLLDMFGYLALQMNPKPSDVYMRIVGNFTVATSNKPFSLSYQLERNHPRVMWPSWVNMYLFLRHSNRLCKSIEKCVPTPRKCANLFASIEQLSLTYAYFVCRFLSGDAADLLCPLVCQRDPCSKIANAVAGSCYSIGFKIHRFDYFCFCKEGYTWQAIQTRDTDGHYSAGKCMKATLKEATKVEDCTRLEMEIFCQAEGTATCRIDRLSDSRRPKCICRDEFSGIRCHFRTTDACKVDRFKGELLCRVHEKVGRCSADRKHRIIPGSQVSPRYNCHCDSSPSSRHIRWREADGTKGEECRQWIPSKWYQRAIGCGYKHMAERMEFREHCNKKGCNDDVILKYVVNLENTEGRACSSNGLCMPRAALLGDTDMSRCECFYGFTGVTCERKYILYPEWTPWSVCFDKGIVDPTDRVSLRFRSCSVLKRYNNGSAPNCINGETERRGCPQPAEDLEDTLTHTDYGVASQAVVSMWRIVELMMLLDGVLLLVLLCLLAYQKSALAAKMQPVRVLD